jgi:hypothetical protein
VILFLISPQILKSIILKNEKIETRLRCSEGIGTKRTASVETHALYIFKGRADGASTPEDFIEGVEIMLAGDFMKKAVGSHMHMQF